MAEPATEDSPADGAKPRRRRATQRELRLRDQRILRRFAAGATLEEIALRERITPRRARERLAAIFARQAIGAPDDFAQVQIRRLNEAMIVAWGAMSGGNLRAVDRVLRITRAFDRYYGISTQRIELKPILSEMADRPPLAAPRG